MADLRELKVSSMCILVLPKKLASIMGIGVGKHFDWVVGFAEHSSHSARHWLKAIKAIYFQIKDMDRHELKSKLGRRNSLEDSL
ncbi:hypothetical protein BHE74_00032007 [Ensete ventricosum]|nr:hypothetical protein BHE74_00032007 [Ensete ventricosum]